jgi:hypothetical protein
MAVDLKRIRKGTIKRPPRVLIYGFDGIGKTGFAAGAPEPLFLDANRGSHNYDVQRVDIADWGDMQEWLLAVENGTAACKTLVLDSITDLEAMSHEFLFKGGTVTDHKGGYGKGDDAVTVEWRKVISQLERIWFRGIAIVVVAHARVKKFEDPTSSVASGGYERFEVGCRPQLAAPLRQWMDYVFFAREEVVIATDKNKGSRATTTGARYCHTRRCPAFDAKARGTFLFPERILLSWRAFEEAVEADSKREDRIASLRKEIDSMLAELADGELTRKVNDYLRQYPAGIVEAHNSVSSKLQEKTMKAEQPKESAA